MVSAPPDGSDVAQDLPLSGVLVLDFSQFLAGPVAALKLADLGARVIKIERPGVGDIGRGLAFAGIEIDGDTLSFHIMNRNKESVAADLKDSADLAFVKELVKKADVIVQNFRPGVMERIGLDYESVRALNPRIVYGSVTGYGTTGPWRDQPGQDLLAQARSGLPWLNGTRDHGPIPVGIAVADVLASCHLATGILGCLVRRARTGLGGLVETSLLEGMIDLQFEVVSAYLYDSAVVPERGPANSAHAYLAAPYGIYPTSDGYLALAMGSVPKLGELLGLEEIIQYDDPRSWFSEQEKILALLSEHLAQQPTAHWLSLLQPADVWCAPVLTLPELVESEGFQAIDMTQPIHRTGASGSIDLMATRAPFRIDGRPLRSPVGAPRLGADTKRVQDELLGTAEK